MRKRSACVVGMLLALLISSAATLAADPPTIQSIRQLYQAVNEGMESGELASTTVQYGSVACDGIGEYIFITGARDSSLRKARARRTSGSMQFLEEFLYYPDGTVAFYLNQTDDLFAEVPNQETRFYFQSGRLIRSIEGKEVSDGPFSKAVMGEAFHALERAEKFKKAFESMPRFGHI